jgi:hypothetical protein
MIPAFRVAPAEGALVVVENLATLEVRGKDRQSWLNGLVTSNLAPLGVGAASYALATSKVGKILADLRVLIAPDRVLVGVAPERIAAIHESFENYLVMEDVDLRDASAEIGWLSIHGPASAQAGALVEAPAIVASLDVTGLGGVLIAAPTASRGAIVDRLASEGARVASAEDWETLRLERAVPVFGVDFDEKTYPQEASLERRAVSFQKGCYLGQEVVCRLEMRGHVHRRLVALVLDQGGGVEPGAEVEAESGDRVGAVTSAIFSPTLGRPVVLAMVKYGSSQPGTQLRVRGVTGQVVETPVTMPSPQA